MRPDFILIGAMKCGTSTVSAYLEDHPEVFMLRGCDPQFFSDDDIYARGTAWYDGLFADAGSARRVGEGSNGYSSGDLYPEAAARMAAHLPDARILYMVRDPVERIASAWIQNRVDHGDHVPPTLAEAVRQMPDRYLGPSRYWRNLQLYRAHYPDDRIFIGFMEDMKADSAAFFADLSAFLDIAPMAAIRRGHVNPSRGKRLPGKLYSTINGLPGVKRMKKIWPASLRRAVKDRLLSRKVGAAAVDPALEREIRALLQEDSAAFLAHCGRPADFWPG